MPGISSTSPGGWRDDRTAVSARESAPDKATHHRVLIVDDEESMRLYLARILATVLKVEVTLAGTCEQALRLARDFAYDAILLDLLMPGVGGFEVLKEIRRASPNTATPVIIVSVLSDQATRERCMRMGANAYVVKPVERNSLIATVKAQIAGRSKPKKKGT
jgi:two-component system copper resistance phosphate regulon response regulator CusR